METLDWHFDSGRHPTTPAIFFESFWFKER